MAHHRGLANYPGYVLSPEAMHTRIADLIANSDPLLADGLIRGNEMIAGIGAGNAVYHVDGNESAADIARSLEAIVGASDRRWASTPVEIANYHVGLETESVFYIYITGVDTSDPRAVGSLRTISLSGENEGAAQKYFRALKHEIVPPELNRLGTEKVVDIADIVVHPSFRQTGPNVSSWLYHGPIRHSDEDGVDRWVTCMNDYEMLLLRKVGANFEQIGDYSHEYDGDGTTYRWYQASPRQVRQEMHDYAVEMLGVPGMRSAYGARALVCRYGVSASALKSMVESLVRIA